MEFKMFMIFNFFELGFFIDLRAPSVPRKTTGRRARGHGERRREPLGRVFGRRRTRGHHTNVLWQFGDVLFFNDFRFFRARIFRRIWSSISASQQISKNIFHQARWAVGSEHRRLVRTPRRLIPPNQPMGQVRTQWRCQENSETASSSSKRLWNFEVFVFVFLRIFGDFLGANTPKRSCSNLGPTLEKAPTSR